MNRMSIMKKFCLTTALALLSLSSAIAQTDAYIKLNDHHGKHPRVVSVAYPGDANTLDMYNSIYGHGAVIENPWVAYRVYMDHRQSLDLYVKHRPGLELDITGFYTTPEQMADGYGCDVLWAGGSIGAGSFRGWQNEVPVTIDSVGTRTQTVISPRCVEVKDVRWVYNGHHIDMTQRYSVSPDSRDLWVEIDMSGHEPADLFCTGIQKLESGNIGFITVDGVGASWGSNVPDKARPELVEQVGLSIFVNPENIVDVCEDELNYLFIVRPDHNGKIRYRVRSCGNREDGGFKSATDWFSHIRALSRHNP